MEVPETLTVKPTAVAPTLMAVLVAVNVPEMLAVPEAEEGAVEVAAEGADGSCVEPLHAMADISAINNAPHITILLFDIA